MAVSRAPVYKRCRYLGINPLVLGYTHKPSARKQTTRRRKVSEYALQLKEKQKVKFVYGVLEKQFRLTYNKAEKMAGKTGDNLLVLLESRFDNIVFRLGFATTRSQARQLINHGHVLLNNKKVDIPSVLLRVGDTIAIKEKMKQKITLLRLEQKRNLPTHLSLDEQTLVGNVVATPNRNELDFEVNEAAIVELYSK
ncbi:MAG: 30S ribosomal protein S4 [Sphaerochaetaceae bacterium]|jgi:small subunit ribosomal protein S4